MATAAAPQKGNFLVPVLIGAGVGASLGYMHSRGEFPGTLEIGQTLNRPEIWLAIGAYFGLGYWILYEFLKPTTAEAKGAWLGTGALWNAF